MDTKNQLWPGGHRNISSRSWMLALWHNGRAHLAHALSVKNSLRWSTFYQFLLYCQKLSASGSLTSIMAKLEVFIVFAVMVSEIGVINVTKACWIYNSSNSIALIANSMIHGWHILLGKELRKSRLSLIIHVHSTYIHNKTNVLPLVTP